MRCFLEMNNHLGNARRKPFTCAKVKRDTAPSPIVDEKFHGKEGLGTASRINAFFLPITFYLFFFDV